MLSEPSKYWTTLEHSATRDRLSEYLSAFLEKPSSPDAAEVHVETEIDVPDRPGSCRPDVRVETPFDNSRGCAFEVKTNIQWRTHLKAIRQLTAYRAAGFQPILVAPGYIFIKNNELKPILSQLSYRNIVREIGAAVVEVVSRDPIRFSPYPMCRQTVMPGLGAFLTRHTLTQSDTS